MVGLEGKDITPGLRVVHAGRNTLGEGPVWDDKQQALLWVDIEGRKVFRLTASDGRVEEASLPKRPGAIALRDGKPGMLVAYEDGFALHDPLGAPNSVPQYIAGQPYRQEGQVRLNDGRCDRRGRFVCGGYNGDEGGEGREWEAACGVYSVDGMAVREMMPYRVRCTNSICFSPAGDVMYFTDSPSREIVAFDYDQEAGQVKPHTRRVFATVPEPGVPDGSIVDSAGYLWNAEFFSGRVVRYAPGGSVDRVIQAPATRTTCPALGGPDLRTLYITSAAVGTPESETHAGALFAIEVATPGLPEPRYRG